MNRASMANEDGVHASTGVELGNPISPGSASPSLGLVMSQSLSTALSTPGSALLHDAAMGPREWFGYLSQYFAAGLMYTGLSSTIYGVFNGYLNVPAHVYAGSLMRVSCLQRHSTHPVPGNGWASWA